MMERKKVQRKVKWALLSFANYGGGGGGGAGGIIL
jgi:hypothetical protein